MPFHQRDAECGVSLAETLIAVSILAGALLSLAQLLTAATSVMTTARHLTMASILATQKLEELRTVVSRSPSVLTVEGGIDYVDRVGAAFPPAGDAAPNAVYTRQWWIRPLPADPDHVSVIQVLVTPGAVREDRSGAMPRRPDGVVLVTMQARDEL